MDEKKGIILLTNTKELSIEYLLLDYALKINANIYEKKLISLKEFQKVEEMLLNDMKVMTKTLIPSINC